MFFASKTAPPRLRPVDRLSAAPRRRAASPATTRTRSRGARRRWGSSGCDACGSRWRGGEVDVVRWLMWLQRTEGVDVWRLDCEWPFSLGSFVLCVLSAGSPSLAHLWRKQKQMEVKCERQSDLFWGLFHGGSQASLGTSYLVFVVWSCMVLLYGALLNFKPQKYMQW